MTVGKEATMRNQPGVCQMFFKGQNIGSQILPIG